MSEQFHGEPIHDAAANASPEVQGNSTVEEAYSEHPLVELSPDEEKEFFSMGKELYVSDLLRFKGIQPDSGHVRVKSGHGIITVMTDSSCFGCLDEPEHPVDGTTASREALPNELESFNNCRSLEDILQQLQQMEKQGESLEGTTKEYSPVELRERLFKASEAVEQIAVPEYMRQLNENPHNSVQFSTIVKQLPQLSLLTRTGGLRDAFIRIISEDGSWFHGFNMDASSDMAGAANMWRQAFDRVPSLETIHQQDAIQSEMGGREKEVVSLLSDRLGVDTTTLEGRQALAEELRKMAQSVENQS